MTRIVITLEVPDGTQVSVSPSTPAVPAAVVPESSPSGSGTPPPPKCDVHRERSMRPSPFGGFYCSAKVGDDAWCDRVWDAQTGHHTKPARPRR